MPPQVPDPRIAWPPANTPASARVFAKNAIKIAATPAAVWSLLIDCTRWPAWYKHCEDVSLLRGTDVLGPDSRFRFKTLGTYFEPEITAFEPVRMLVWRARGPLRTSGAHAWYIEPTEDGGCYVITEECQKGLLLAFVGRRIHRILLTSHQHWIESLKQLAEQRAISASSPS